MFHTPLHRLPERQSLCTGGRLQREADRWQIVNAHVELELVAAEGSQLPPELSAGSLVRISGHRRENTLVARQLDVVHRPSAEPPSLETNPNLDLGEALRARHHLNRQIRAFFEEREFLEVNTPALIRAPGTDPHIEPVPATFYDAYSRANETRAYLHTSPELKMKRLLASGAGPIYQLCNVWRNGEVTPLHNPEFTILEWYRPWENLECILDDVQALVSRVLDGNGRPLVEAPIPRISMAELVERVCGFDLLECLDVDSLRHAIERRDLLSDRAMEKASWDELFYSLTVSHLDPYLETQGALFVTDWPAPLAILARRNEEDPRRAERFELYVDGVELANGFGELTDPDEQRRRFDEDNATRRRLGLEELPTPDSFLQALHWGLPPSAGVALGVDRLLLLSTPGAEELVDIAPFALRRGIDGIQWN